jgi:diguanylate cyclase (GGDEF)-like protein
MFPTDQTECSNIQAIKPAKADHAPVIRALGSAAQLLMRSTQVQGVALILLDTNGLRLPLLCQTGSIKLFSSNQVPVLMETLEKTPSDQWAIQACKPAVWGIEADLLAQPIIPLALRHTLVANGLQLVMLAVHSDRGALQKSVGLALNQFFSVARSLCLPLNDLSGPHLIASAFIASGNAGNQTTKAALPGIDVMTGLPNQLNFEHTLKEAFVNRADDGTHLALALIDIDNFEEINRTHGSAFGDQLLRDVSARLQQELRASRLVARLRGCRFGLLFDSISNRHQLQALGAIAASCFNEPFCSDSFSIKLTASIGMAATSKNISNASLLTAAADQACSDAKETGPGQLVKFSDVMSASMHTRDLLSKSMLSALQRKEFELYYQPIHCLASREVIGAEALVRWNHPSLGLIQPEDFLAIAQANGLIKQVGQWILETACVQAKQWSIEGHPNFRMSVNVSPMEFAEIGFYQMAKTALELSGLNAKNLSLEINELALTEAGPSANNAIKQLQNLGITITLDDFGIGKGGFAPLLNTQVDRIKLDRQFIGGLGQPGNDRHETLIQAILDFAVSMKLSVTAEGIENLYQLDFLAQSGCQDAQGYFLGGPIQAQRFTDFLNAPPDTQPFTLSADIPTLTNSISSLFDN